MRTNKIVFFKTAFHNVDTKFFIVTKFDLIVLVTLLYLYITRKKINQRIIHFMDNIR